jgi:hypothetical protein
LCDELAKRTGSDELSSADKEYQARGLRSN